MQELEGGSEAAEAASDGAIHGRRIRGLSGLVVRTELAVSSSFEALRAARTRARTGYEATLGWLTERDRRLIEAAKLFGDRASAATGRALDKSEHAILARLAKWRTPGTNPSA